MSLNSALADAAQGLAAPQVSVNKQLFIVEVEGSEAMDEVPFTAIFNPRFKFTGDQKILMLESCISVPHYFGLVSRYKSLELSYLNIHGEPERIQASGFIAGLMQHEADHLIGKLYVDRLDMNKDFYHLDMIADVVRQANPCLTGTYRKLTEK